MIEGTATDSARGGDTGQNENACSDYRPDTEPNEAPGAEQPLQAMLGIFRLFKQPVDAFCLEKLGHCEGRRGRPARTKPVAH